MEEMRLSGRVDDRAFWIPFLYFQISQKMLYYKLGEK